MAGKSRRSKLVLSADDVAKLEQLSRSRTVAKREAQRAEVLLRYHAGENVTSISRSLRMTRVSVSKWVTKAFAVGSVEALKDNYHRPKEPVIGDDAKAWVVHLACSKPKDLGYAAETWSRQSLAKHVRGHSLEAGYPALSKAAKATVHRILAEQTLHPEKIKYYLERRDPDFEAKMREVLIVYQDVALQNEKRASGESVSSIITVSVDEKPGLQAIANTSPDLPPVAGKYPEISRDHEYKRLGTCSILAALDLQDGHITARVERRHRSAEFTALLADLDAWYPPQCTIRIILDNHSAPISKETRAFLAAHPNRFQYVLTPTHGSWLNIVETLFGKMARTFLRHIRVHSWEELKTRILKGIAEINAAPVVHRWKKFDALTTG
ncbi:MAG: IS630 family transposase [Acidobacteriota bacterium]|nr:IS630 family transposase [Acidobacteriota bacterium]